jgi:hypothetical protein
MSAGTLIQLQAANTQIKALVAKYPSQIIERKKDIELARLTNCFEWKGRTFIDVFPYWVREKVLCQRYENGNSRKDLHPAICGAELAPSDEY